ncbi:hypothetical protein [Amycolatopsis sp. 195334CR]|uniref:hypothetical protein n=1 Tax=Amycolatopsis sp. 195334CR TaxID=2814588 RepID=UPI001A900FCE|nr:hypothetical protein [Amycolatopsis sp. 195334CR]MBN6039597.1 hypothetical protein [Amycolatopsis sp. 195334CR]
MKGIRRTITIAAACVALVACGSPGPDSDPPGAPGGTTSEPGEGTDSTGGSDSTDGTDGTGGTGDTGGTGGAEVTDEPPDIPGGPIDYDNTRTGGGRSPAEVKEDMEGQLADHEQCGRNRCGVKVVISGKGDCVESVTPRPVKPGGRITVLARPCIDDEKPPSEEPSEEAGKPAKSKPVESPAPNSEPG